MSLLRTPSIGAAVRTVALECHENGNDTLAADSDARRFGANDTGIADVACNRRAPDLEDLAVSLRPLGGSRLGRSPRLRNVRSCRAPSRAQPDVTAQSRVRTRLAP